VAAVTLARVAIELHASDRQFKLPGGGSRSLLYRFGEVLLGARAVTADGRDLSPGSSHPDVTLEFWADEADAAVAPGAAFTVWYGEDVGSGVVLDDQGD
jgi:hypothetical protein